MLLIALILTLSINIMLFIPAFLFKTDKLTDLSYSISFIITTLIILLLTNTTKNAIIIASLIVIWGIRLGTFLFIRIQKMNKDKRFDGIRENFFKFLGFWLLQAITVWIILLPTLIFISKENSKIYHIGILIWLIGITVETIADIQKYKFRQKSKSFITTGLWKYSRHPNYFGEILCWIGIYIATVPNLLGLISPIFITILITKFSGIPPLEKYATKKWGSKYLKYKNKTNSLIPWPPK